MSEVQFFGKSMVRIVDLDFPPIKVYKKKVSFMADVRLPGQGFTEVSVQARSILEARDLVWEKLRDRPHDGFVLWRLGPGG